MTMTISELAERDLRKAEHSLVMAKKRPNVPEAELEHIEELCRLRKEILEIIKSTDVAPTSKRTNREHLSTLDNQALIEWVLFDAPEVGRMSTNSPRFLAEWLDSEYDGWLNLREYSNVMMSRMKGGE